MTSKRLVIFSCGSLVTAMMLWPAEAAAQRAVARPAPRSAAVVSGGYYQPYHRPYYRPYYPYYAPFYASFYAPFYAPFYSGFGFSAAFGWGGPYWGVGLGWGGGYPFYGAYPAPYPGYYLGNPWASARVEVKPTHAQVFVDGYYVGVVDQFDGVFQRLDLPTGEHEVAVYLPGHRTYTQRTLFRPGTGYHFKAVLEPLPPGTPEEPAPKPVPGAVRGGDPDPQGNYEEPRDPRDPRDPRPPQRTMPMPERPDQPRGDRAPQSRDFGTLNLRVQPMDAVVIIDGERWDSPEGGSRLVVQLSGGSHRIEVRKEGFRTYTSTFQIRPGEAQSLNISLTPGGMTASKAGF